MITKRCGRINVFRDKAAVNARITAVMLTKNAVLPLYCERGYIAEMGEDNKVSKLQYWYNADTVLLV